MTTHIIEAPYGWRADADGKLVPDEGEQVVIARVREARARGLTVRAIAEELAAAGIAMEGVRTCTAEEHLRDNGVKLGGTAGGASHGGDRRIVDGIADECRSLLAHADSAMPHVPYGWRLVDGCLVVDDGEQVVLTHVRALRAAGLSQCDIVAELRRAGLISEDSQ